MAGEKPRAGGELRMAAEKPWAGGELRMAAEKPWAGRELHFVGIGGAGMSGLALVARGLGARVTGSDRAGDSPYVGPLHAAGIAAAVGHDAANVPEAAEIVFSTAIPPENPERAVARERGQRELHRAELLGELTRLKPTIAVTGTHGKTTTASMLVHALRACGMDPSYLVGGEVRSTGATALSDFPGAGRRFERLGRTPSGAEVVDDYAHHPTEVSATLAAARTLAPRRLVAAFQPHLFSRTARHAREFGEALAGADLVVVLDIYPARERAGDYPGVTGLLVAQAAADHADGRPVAWLPTQDAARPLLQRELREGDLLLTLGAGDLDRLGRALVGA